MLAEGTVEPQPQDDRRASPAPKLFRDDARIDWAQPAQRVHDHVRALSPFPGAWTTWNGETLKVLRTRISDGAGRPGEVLEAGPRLVVACADGAVEVLEAQREGKKRTAGGRPAPRRRRRPRATFSAARAA